MAELLLMKCSNSINGDNTITIVYDEGTLEASKIVYIKNCVVTIDLFKRII